MAFSEFQTSIREALYIFTRIALLHGLLLVLISVLCTENFHGGDNGAVMCMATLVTHYEVEYVHMPALSLSPSQC